MSDPIEIKPGEYCWTTDMKQPKVRARVLHGCTVTANDDTPNMRTVAVQSMEGQALWSIRKVVIGDEAAVDKLADVVAATLMLIHTSVAWQLAGQRALAAAKAEALAPAPAEVEA